MGPGLTVHDAFADERSDAAGQRVDGQRGARRRSRRRLAVALVLAALTLGLLGAAEAVQRRQPALPGAWATAFSDEFEGDALDLGKWSYSDDWQREGWGEDSAWFPVPPGPAQLEVAEGVVTLKSRRGDGLPEGRAFTSAHINSRGKFELPAGATTYTEARIKASSAKGTLPGFWLLGNGTDTTGQGWPITGEIDILEFANNAEEGGRPYFSVWYPRDVYTDPPGTFLNGIHDTHEDSARERRELLDSWHTWGLLRSPEQMTLFIDGAEVARFRPGVAYGTGIPLPEMLFTGSQHLRFSLLVGGDWAGSGFDEQEYEEADLAVDHVTVWREDENPVTRALLRVAELTDPLPFL